jgi:hypothetical protein
VAFQRFDGELYPQGSSNLARPGPGRDDDDLGSEILRPSFTGVVKRCPGLTRFLSQEV